MRPPILFVSRCTRLLVLHLLLVSSAFAQHPHHRMLDLQIRKVADSLNGKVRVGIMGLDFADTLLLNGNTHFPMQSVFKFPLAIVVLDDVDKGKLSLAKKVSIRRRDLMQDTWSPMLKDYKSETIEITISDLLRYSVSKSDNNACDILFGQVGGTKRVDDFLKKKGVSQIRIAATEYEMTKAWDAQYSNWSTPPGMLNILRLFYSGKLLKPSSNSLLMKLMVESENSPTRIKGLLPEKAVVAHKTGTGNMNAAGVRSATNDVAIITLPDGRHYALVVFVSDYTGGIETGEKTIAKISKLVWDYYTGTR